MYFIHFIHVLYGYDRVSLQREILEAGTNTLCSVTVLPMILKLPSSVPSIWQAAVCVNDALILVETESTKGSSEHAYIISFSNTHP